MIYLNSHQVFWWFITLNKEPFVFTEPILTVRVRTSCRSPARMGTVSVGWCWVQWGVDRTCPAYHQQASDWACMDQLLPLGSRRKEEMKFSGNYTLKCKKTNQTKKHPQKENLFKKKIFKYSHQEPCRCKSYTSLFFKSLKLMSVKNSFLLLNFLSFKKIII